ncbi:anti-sigma-D factor RsdA [Rhodococcus sp. SGAir0479]|uniref:anti-sigma-D factor RsdA n=1 Tax=Rhodococcus sp. SGAir0479 TaxID=2567884 RepID=UPI0010CCC6BF|nr:anti-sigma-D factor RsdA [Rhodococcus sp. SGAir0479]QCQ92120.1 hypothetical protein E7742_13435 [Rhodococcus sp. SGAir0479]
MARGHNGEPGDPHADLAGNGGPVDVSAVRRDDALIDAIAGDGPVATDSPEEYQVAALLANWRTEILAQPMPAEPDLDEIVERVGRELEATRSLTTTRTRSGRGQLRLLRPIAAAAAVVAIAMGGMTIFSYNAEPGDPLWGVKQVVFTERAASTVAKIDTTSNLEEAERLIATGDTAGAKAKLESAAARANAVNEAGTRDELNGWRQRLLTELDKVLPPLPPAPVPSEGVDGTTGQSSSVPGSELGSTATWAPTTTPNPGLMSIPATSTAPQTPPETTSATPTPVTSVPSTSSPTPTSTSAPATSTSRATSGSIDGSPPSLPALPR